jgi:hypothetical protein
MTDQDRLDRLNVLFKMHDLKLHCCVLYSNDISVFRINCQPWGCRDFEKLSNLEKYSHGLIKQSVRDLAGFKNRIEKRRIRTKN